jgi:hypothetical protein
MAPLFVRAPKNCQLPEEWIPLLKIVNEEKNGTNKDKK